MNIQRIIEQTFVARAEHHEVLDSTNSLARRYAQSTQQNNIAKAGDQPLLLVAERQTAGRGRGGNRWWTGKGSLAFSLLLPADMFPDERGQTPLAGLAAAVAVAETVSPLVNDKNASVHWPNDVYAGDRKLSGILVEVLADRRRIVGIGLNVNNSMGEAPDEIRKKVVALCDLADRSFDREEILIEILQKLEKQLVALAKTPAAVAQAANRLCGQAGQTLSLKIGDSIVSGRCLGIADDGGLVLETPQGQQTFYSGTLH